jgi:hypothetical protein
LNQRVEELTGEEIAHLEKQRNWVRDHYDPNSRGQYESMEGKLRLLEVILSSGWVKPEETWKLQSLGVAFGDALKQRLGLTWVAVEDEIDRVPALQAVGTTIILYPLTMIEKRVVRGEQFEVRHTINQLCSKVDEIRGKRAD